jgi:hypothetical protein
MMNPYRVSLLTRSELILRTRFDNLMLTMTSSGLESQAKIRQKLRGLSLAHPTLKGDLLHWSYILLKNSVG